MSKRFVPVSDPEKARCEQDEESLRKHRAFDTPFALLPKDLNNQKQPRQERAPLAGKELTKAKNQLFAKEITWGRETSLFSNPEQTRTEAGNKKYQPGEVFWGAKGTYGDKREDNGTLVLQRGEVNQAMELNEKGLWVRKKDAGKEAAAPGLSDGADMLLRKTKKSEDPRMEAAAQKGRGGPDAAKKALEALERRRNHEKRVAEEMGLSKGKIREQKHTGGPVVTMHNSSQQLKPQKRAARGRNYQTVAHSADEARDKVEKALGSAAVGSGPMSEIKRAEPTTGRKVSRSPSPVVPSSDDEGGKFAWEDSDDEDKKKKKERSRSRSRSPRGDTGTAEEVEVDFF
eukprot:TRINITY_DN42196_c0_g1_i1.p1 TRINITY_DN42196_c0_g1~~TRINITY_DN42196_c0_g1_i1.p1  ORF type:complete len:344 (-),score=95.40 TRINITY_DN42196_c0_g1_i1:20-1051(-)